MEKWKVGRIRLIFRTPSWNQVRNVLCGRILVNYSWQSILWEKFWERFQQYYQILCKLKERNKLSPKYVIKLASLLILWGEWIEFWWKFIWKQLFYKKMYSTGNSKWHQYIFIRFHLYFSYISTFFFCVVTICNTNPYKCVYIIYRSLCTCLPKCEWRRHHA